MLHGQVEVASGVIVAPELSIRSQRKQNVTVVCPAIHSNARKCRIPLASFVESPSNVRHGFGAGIAVAIHKASELIYLLASAYLLHKTFANDEFNRTINRLFPWIDYV